MSGTNETKLILRLSAEGGQVVVREITDVTEATKEANNALNETGPAGSAAKAGMDDAANSSTVLNSHMRTLLQSVSVLVGGLGAMALIDRADEWGQYASRIRQATKSAEEYDYVQSRMVASANETFRSITETRESFISMSPILRDMGYQLSQSIDIVDSFSSLLVTNAASSDKAQSAQAALSKSIQSGRVEADAWQTIFGVMPSILNNLTEATGKSGTEIRELGVSGKLSITDLTNALLTNYEANRKAVEGMPTTVRDALTNLNTVFSNYIGVQNEAYGATELMASGIGLVSENFDTFVNIVGGVAAAALVNYTAQLGYAGAARIKKMNADMAGLAVDAQAAAGADRAAQAEKMAALAELDRATAAVASAEAQVAASRMVQAEELNRLKTMQAALAAELAVEKQRHAAQISETGRVQSFTRMGEIRLLQVGVSKQIEASEKALAATTTATSTSAQTAYAKRAQAAAQAAAAIKAANATAIDAEKAANATNKLRTAGMGALGMLGGPAGLAITAGIAATALLSFGDSNNEVTQTLQSMQQPLEDIRSKFAALNKDQREAQQVKWADAQAEAAIKAQGAFTDLYDAVRDTVAPANIQSVIPVSLDSYKQWANLSTALKAAKEESGDLSPILRNAAEAAGVPQNKINEWIKLAGQYSDAAEEAKKAGEVIKNVNDSANTPDGKDPAGLTGQNKELEKSLLALYNAQMLNAQAIDATGAAMTGIDLALFKASFEEVTKLPADAEAAIRSFYKTAEAAAQLTANEKHLADLKEELRLQQIRLQLGEAEYELAKAASSQKVTNPAQLKQLKDLLKLQSDIAQVKTEDDALKALKQENDLMQIRLDKGESEYELQKMVRELKINDPAMIALLDLEIDRQRQLNEQLDVRKYLTDGSYDDVLDGLTKVGDVGSAAGNALVSAFGSVADQFANMADQQDEFTKKFLELSEARKKAEKETNPALRTKALEKADAVERSLMEDQFRMQVGGYATLTNAAGKMFSENSKGRQIMHRMETTFAAIETALALKKAAANALTAITNQGGGDPYTAFGRIAAMVALMAGLGVFSGSSSASGTSSTSRQESQGTGTVLGDSAAKSESIANSLERIESLELDQYAELRSINTSIRALNAGIAQLATNLVANFGRFNEDTYQGELGKEYKVQLGSGLAAGALFAPLQLAGLLDTLLFTAVDKMLGGVLGSITNKFLGGLFGSTKKELVDSGISFAAQELGDILATGLVDATLYDVIKTTKKKAFGLSKSTRENTEYRDLDEEIRAEFGKVFSYIGSSVIDAVEVLGLTTSKSLEDFVIKLPNVSFKDLSGDEIEKELQAIFSQQGDLMAKFLIPGIAEFQQMGEGLYDTLIRVAQEQAVFNSSLDALGLQLSRFAGVTKAVEVDVAQALIELMGGIEEFTSATSSYFEEFYSEAEQQAYLAKLVSDQFKSLNIALPASREGFKDLIDGIDITTESGQQLFAALMKLIDPLDQLYDAAEDAAKAAEKAAEEEKKLAAERSKYNASVRSDIDRMGMSPLQIALDDINKWYADATAEAKALGADTGLLTSLYNKKREALATEYVSKSIQSAEAAMTSLVADYQRTVEQLGQTLASVLDSIAGMSDTIRGDILNLRKTLPEFDAVGYYSGEVASLSAQLGTGTATAQLDIIGKLKAAMLERYNAELAAIGTNMDALQNEQDLKQELYDTQLEQFEALKEAALGLKAAAASLLYSDLSTLTAGERLQQLQSQYNSAVTKARGGDAEAYGQVQELGEQLLQMSRDYNPAAYSGVFDSVLAVFNELGNKTFAEPTAPAPHPAVAAFEAEKIALARQTIAQLEALTGRTESLNAVANAEYKSAIDALKAQFSVDAAGITTALNAELAAVRAVMPAETDRVVAKMQEQIDAILNMRDGVIGAIKVIPVPEPVLPVDLTPIVEPIRLVPPKLDKIWSPLPILPPYLRDIFGGVKTGAEQTTAALNVTNARLFDNRDAVNSLKTAALTIGVLPNIPQTVVDFRDVLGRLDTTNARLFDNRDAVNSLKTAALTIGVLPNIPQTVVDFTSVLGRLDTTNARLADNQNALSTIARADFVTKPIIIPPANVNVNVDMQSVVTELRAVQHRQQLQIDQQTATAAETTRKLTEVVESNKTIGRELGDFGSQLVTKARIG